MAEKRSTGPNARPKDETIAQSGEGLPDDTGRVLREATEADEAAARRSLKTLGKGSRQTDRRQESRPGEEGRRARKSDRR